MKTAVKISKHIPSVFQGSLDFSRGRAISLSVEHPLEAVISRYLMGIIVFLLLGYLYFVSASVLNVIARKEALTGIAKVQSTISVTEQQYFTLSQAMTPAEGASLGLAPLTETSYVYRPGNTAVATNVTERNI